MRTPKGFRRIELFILIALHERVKKIAKDDDGASQGRTANLLLALGIQKFDEEKAKAESEDKPEPADEATGD